MFSLPVFEYDIKNNNAKEKITRFLPDIIDNTNAVIMVGLDETECRCPISDDQNFFNVLGCFHRKESYSFPIKEIIDQEEKEEF